MPAVPPLAATGVAQRVVLLSLDGLGADMLTRETTLKSFNHLANHGARFVAAPAQRRGDVGHSTRPPVVGRW